MAWDNSVSQSDAPREPTLDELAAELLRRRRARENLAEYMHYMHGKKPPLHMKYLCGKLEEKMARKGDRLLICEPPGHGKSTVSSLYFPAFYLSKFPTHNVIAVSHTESFAEQWGRKVRNLLMSDEHRLLFPNCAVSDDSRSAGRWDLIAGGSYYATGVGGAVTGRRADIVVCDDLLKGVDDAESQLVRDNMWEWWGSDLSTRLKPNGIMVVIGTRWHLDDIIGRLLASEKQKGGDKWDKVILPALAKKNDPLGRKEGEALWPEWEDEKALERRRSQSSMSQRQWSALYMQDPVIEGGNILRREWFRIWNEKDPPKCRMVIQSWDTATSKKQTAAYSACTTWGIFKEKDSGIDSMILLSAFRRRMDYPELRKMAQRLAYDYLDDNYEFPAQSKVKRAPDMILVEDMSSGSQLIPDLLRAGISCTPVRPKAYGDKDARVHLSSDLMENGRVWVPGQPPNYTTARRWAEEVIQACISYPSADSRDWVDTVTQVCIRVKKSGIIENSENWYEEKPFRVTGGAKSQPLYG